MAVRVCQTAMSPIPEGRCKDTARDAQWTRLNRSDRMRRGCVIEQRTPDFQRAIIRPVLSGARATVATVLLACAQAGPAHSTHTIPYMTPASNEVQ